MKTYILQSVDSPLDQEYQEGKMSITEYALKKREEIDKRVREKFGLKGRDEDEQVS